MRRSTHAHLSKKCAPIFAARRRCHTKPEPCVGSSSESRLLQSGSGKKQSLPLTSKPPRCALIAAAGGRSAQSQASSRHAAGFSAPRARGRIFFLPPAPGCGALPLAAMRLLRPQNGGGKPPFSPLSL